MTAKEDSVPCNYSMQMNFTVQCNWSPCRLGAETEAFKQFRIPRIYCDVASEHETQQFYGHTIKGFKIT